MSKDLLELSRLSTTEVLKEYPDIDDHIFGLHRGDIVAVAGYSGAGKIP